MTNKRYFALYSEGDIYPTFFDGEEDDRELDVEEVVELLNKSSELEQLKRFLEWLKESGYWSERYLIEQDWNDLKIGIDILMGKIK